MKVLVSGASGFVGSHLCNMLLAQGHSVYGLTRKINALQDKNIIWIESDLSTEIDGLNMLDIDVFIHLAWQGLDNYQSVKHCRDYVDQHFNYLTRVIKAGVKQIQVIGTCFEYGMVNGEVSESHPKAPITEYGKAKNLLRKKLQKFQKNNEFSLQWVRLFYLYGEGQRPSSFFPLLQAAIHSNQTLFPMSTGAQIRDYLEVNTAASYLVKLMESRQVGVFNCCSNNPLSMKDFAINIIQASNSSLKLKLGVFPYLDYEPMEFWGSNKKLLRALNINSI